MKSPDQCVLCQGRELSAAISEYERRDLCARHLQIRHRAQCSVRVNLCRARGCFVQIQAGQFACAPHWDLLPDGYKRAISKTMPGGFQNHWYRTAARAAIKWWSEHNAL